MSCESFSVTDTVRVDLGDALTFPEIAQHFRKELSPHSSLTTAKIRLTISGRTPHSPSKVYGVTGGLHDERFLVPDGAGHWVAFDPAQLSVDKQLDIALDLCCRHHRANVLLEWLVMPIAHFALAAAGRAPLHASGATLPDRPAQPVVFSAWSGVGKTNLVLWALSHRGSFYGDDQVVVDSEGRAYPSSRRIGVYGYNRKLARGLPTSTRLRLGVGDNLHKAARSRKGKLAYLVAYGANGLGAARVTAEELGGRSATVAGVHSHLICHSATGTKVSVSTPLKRSAQDVAAYAAAHTAVMEYEYAWFRRYLQTWQWAVSSTWDPWSTLRDKWTENLGGYFEAVQDLLEVDIPRGNPSDVAEAVWARAVAETPEPVVTS